MEKPVIIYYSGHHEQMVHNGFGLRLIVFLIACLLTSASVASSAEQQLPNVVIIYVDDMGFGDLAAQNPECLIPTPHLDELAAEGMRFTDGHSSSSLCSPSRYALLSGRYHWRHSEGLTNEMTPSAFSAEQLTMPEMFQELGYTTAAFGKWHLGFNWAANKKPGVTLKDRRYPNVEDIDWTLSAPDGPTSHGFDHYFGDGTPNFPPYAWVEDDRIFGELPTVNAPRLKELSSRPGPSVDGWQHDRVMPTLTKRAVSWIADRRDDDQPFFVYFSTTSPHTPLLPVEPFVGSTRVGQYGDYMAQTDWSAGQVLAALEKHGFRDNTVVIFTSDNGPAGSMQKRFLETEHNSSGPLRGKKLDIWEGGHRVPFVVRWPGVTRPGTVSNALISQIDLMATFAAAFEYPLPEGQAEDSLNMMPVIRGEVKNVRETLVLNNRHWGLRQGDWVFLEDPQEGCRDDYLRALDFPKIPKGEDALFNLADDPGQRNNLVKQYPQRAEQMSAALHAAIKNRPRKRNAR